MRPAAMSKTDLEIVCLTPAAVRLLELSHLSRLQDWRDEVWVVDTNPRAFLRHGASDRRLDHADVGQRAKPSCDHHDPPEKGVRFSSWLAHCGNAGMTRTTGSTMQSVRPYGQLSALYFAWAGSLLLFFIFLPPLLLFLLLSISAFLSSTLFFFLLSSVPPPTCLRMGAFFTVRSLVFARFFLPLLSLTSGLSNPLPSSFPPLSVRSFL